MSKISWKGSALLAPLPPALVTCGVLEQPNILTVGWTGIVCTRPPMTYISLRPERFSYPIVCRTGEFAVNLPTVALARAVDFCGVKSGRDTDKLAACHLSVEPASRIAAPLLADSPVSLECRVQKRLPLGSHEMFLAEIVAVSVDPALLDGSGRLDLGRAGLLAYAHGHYYSLGKALGGFGFSVQKKPPRRPPRAKR